MAGSKVNNPQVTPSTAAPDNGNSKDPEFEALLRRTPWRRWSATSAEGCPVLKDNVYFRVGARRGDRRLMNEPDLDATVMEGCSVEDIQEQCTVRASHVFYKLPYWNECAMRGPDPMHTLGGVVSDILTLVKGEAYTREKMPAIARFEHFVNLPDRWHALLAKYLPESIRKRYYPGPGPHQAAPGSDSGTDGSDESAGGECSDSEPSCSNRRRRGGRAKGSGRLAGITKKQAHRGSSRVKQRQSRSAKGKKKPREQPVREGLPWKATPSARARALGRLKALVSSGYAPSSIAYSELHNCMGNLGWLKTHHKVLLAGDLGKYALCAGGGQAGGNVVGEPYLRAYCDLLDAISALWSTHVRYDRLDALERGLVHALVRFEACVPGWEMDRLLHLLIHVPERMRWSGPCWAHSMFPFERLWGRIDKWRKSHKHPEASIIKAYRAYMAAIQVMGNVLDTSSLGAQAEEDEGADEDDSRSDSDSHSDTDSDDSHSDTESVDGGDTESDSDSSSDNEGEQRSRGPMPPPANIRNDELERSVDYLLMPQYVHDLHVPRLQLDGPLNKGLPYLPLGSRSVSVRKEGMRLRWQLHEYYLRGEGGSGPGVVPGTTLAYMPNYAPITPSNMYADMWNQYVIDSYGGRYDAGNQQRVLDMLDKWQRWALEKRSEGIEYSEQQISCCQGPSSILECFARASVNGIVFKREAACSHRKAKGDCLIVTYTAEGRNDVRYWAGIATKFYRHRRPDAPAASLHATASNAFELVVDAKWFDLPAGRQQSEDHIRGLLFKRAFRRVSKDDLWPLREVMPTQFVMAPYDDSKFILLHRSADWRDRDQWFLH